MAAVSVDSLLIAADKPSAVEPAEDKSLTVPVHRNLVSQLCHHQEAHRHEVFAHYQDRSQFLSFHDCYMDRTLLKLVHSNHYKQQLEKE